MVNPELFAAFLIVTAILIVTPGPVVTLVIATGATGGARAVLATIAGTSLGTGLVLAAVALGLNWVLNNSIILFEVMRWAGAAYLVWLGIQAWRSAGGPAQAPVLRQRVYLLRGMWVALSNPKTIAFFTAFLPQFIDPALPAGPQLAIMCVASVLMAAVLDMCWGIAASMGRNWFMTPARAKLLARVSGSVLVGGGLWLALARR